MKKKLGIMLSTSVFTFSGFGMELQQDVSSTKSSTVTVQTAMTEDMEDKSAEQMAEIQKLLETQIQAAQVEVDFLNKTIEILRKNLEILTVNPVWPKKVDLQSPFNIYPSRRESIPN